MQLRMTKLFLILLSAELTPELLSMAGATEGRFGSRAVRHSAFLRPSWNVQTL